MNQLSPHQTVALAEVMTYLEEKHRHIRIIGSAGVGKTFLLNYLVEILNTKLKSNNILICSAPTHKAVSVIRGKVDADVEFKTIHSVLHYRALYNSKGEKEFKSVPNRTKPPLFNVKYLIIDEASMIDKVMLDNIMQYAEQQGTTVIYVGDNKQINPVGEEHSAVFLQDFPEVELTEIVRQAAGNPIIKLSRELELISRKEDNAFEELAKGYLYTENLARIIQELAQVNGTDEIKYLAWTNEDVNYVNTLVRKRIYGDNPAKVELGESIIFDSPYGDYNTNEELVVETVTRRAMDFKVTLCDQGKNKQIETVRFNVFIVNDGVYILDDSSQYLFNKYSYMVRTNSRQGLLSYEERDEYLNLFAHFKYNHALTVHKSQGSTYQTTILNVRNINLNSNLVERKRLLYTGVTRASELLILYNV